ncbi:hypothetical protein J2752_001281 [Halarchaeum rubridurum]|uniref:Dolichyl-phosphate-mannose-protein mannosyltransferase n=1 Tax=Halarchaeum rubridurum TaxID=489911 RepID=A0A830FQB1_9EURY|nr:hypothetical protein [Halarchaeum rubridurum]MBP1954369.1 hypothetical protein [Halarchaeum rubridurum]GGM60422.1 hypothetical protein GCM10009017_08270 [Halarchaeum rubridurum]
MIDADTDGSAAETSGRPDVPLLAAVVAVGLAARLSSLHVSALPYNTDAFVFASSAERLLAAGGVPLDPAAAAAPAADQYLFVTLLAAASELTGVDPLFVAQAVVACLAVVPSFVAVVFVRDLTADLPDAHGRAAAAFAGLGLAVEGPSLFRTMSVSGEVYGLALLAVLVLALGRAHVTGRRRWVALAVAAGAAMPVAHNLSALVAGLVLTTVAALALARRPTRRRFAAGALGVVAFWALTLGYYEAVDLPKADTAVASLGLFAAWLVFVVALARWLDASGPRVQRAVPLAAFAGGLALLAANALVALYPARATTSTLLLCLTLPLLAVLAAAALGVPRLATDRGIAVLAVVLGPLAALGFGLTAGSTPRYLDLVVRATGFFHLGVLVAAAAGLAALVHRRPRLGRVAACGVVLALLVSAPLPFLGLQAFPFEPITEPGTFDAATFATTHLDGTWAADDHVALVADNYRAANVTRAPVTAWLRGDAPPPDCPTVARDAWTTVGAPTATGPVRLNRSAYEAWLMNGSVVYDGGTDRAVVRWAPGTCRAGVSP